MDKKQLRILDHGKVVVMGEEGIVEPQQYALIVEDQKNGGLYTRVANTTVGNMIRACILIARDAHYADEDVLECVKQMMADTK